MIQEALEQAAVDDAAPVQPFNGMDPSVVLSLLASSVKKEDCINGRVFWKTYGVKWESLTVDQRNKTVVFWNMNISAEVRNRILAEAREKLLAEVEDENIRQAITTKHDKARILHLRVDPSAAADWTSALREKSRAQLDLNNDNPDADPWNRLAEKFNNYEAYKYQNACIIPGRLDAAGCNVPVPGMDRIAMYCHDINPSMPNRPFRDGGWLRIQYRDLKTKISVCFNNYHRSGNQDEENAYDEWVKFSTAFSNDIVTYARCLLTVDQLDQLGKAIPAESQRDTGMIEPGSENEESRRLERLRESRKRQREAVAAKRGTSTPASGNQNPTSGDQERYARSNSVATVIQEGLQKQNELAAIAQARDTKLAILKMQLEFGNAADKADALRELRDMKTMQQFN